jgi:murein DD-endopeptidase MepM/ murein hydrolase activator NlpD
VVQFVFLIFCLFAFSAVLSTVTASREAVKIDLHFICPVDGDLVTGFGSVPMDRGHGIEYIVPSKQPIVASERGTVRYVGGPISNFDKIVLISHPLSVFTVYGDIEDIVVEIGQTVRRGDILGYTAKRPNNNQYGVHFQMRFGSPYDTSGIDPHTISKERSNMRYHCITNKLS